MEPGARRLISLLCLLTFVPAAHANEQIFTKEEARRLGYAPVVPATQTPESNLIRKKALPEAHSLPWPVPFEDANHSMGNVMTQFQYYGDAPYWHGGCDLRTRDNEEIHAPISGRIEAGHYGYVINDDGSLTKQMKPWPQRGNDHYFEVAIVTDSGMRFEFHHIDRASLPDSLVEGLNKKQAHVSAGDLLGRVIHWSIQGPDGSLYHHTHYNIIDSNGVQLNPEYLSPLIADTAAPLIEGVWAVGNLGAIETVREGQPVKLKNIREFVVGTTDRNDGNVYLHSPVRSQLRWNERIAWNWNFGMKLLAPDGIFPNIHDVYKDSMRTPEGQHLETSGDYDNNFFLIRLPVPNPVPSGIFEIRIEDASGNASLFSASTP